MCGEGWGQVWSPGLLGILAVNLNGPWQLPGAPGLAGVHSSFSAVVVTDSTFNSTLSTQKQGLGDRTKCPCIARVKTVEFMLCEFHLHFFFFFLKKGEVGLGNTPAFCLLDPKHISVGL